jgi:hypothetical protein
MTTMAFAMFMALLTEASPPPYGPLPAWEIAVPRGNAAIQKQLVDPQSAQIEWPYTLIGGTLTIPRQAPRSGWYTCGWVNAKNRMGGYAGRRQFLIMFYEGQPSHVEIGGTADETCRDIASKGWLRSSGLEALGAMQPGIQPEPQSFGQTNQAVADAAFKTGGAGISLLPTPAGAVVMAVTRGSPAERAGLKVGQVAETIEGINLKGMPMAALAAVLQGAPKTFELFITGIGRVKVLEASSPAP